MTAACVVCGAAYEKLRNRKTCSEACSRKRTARTVREWRRRNRWRVEDMGIRYREKHREHLRAYFRERRARLLAETGGEA